MPSVHHSWFSIGLAGALLSANSGAQTIPPEVQTVAQLEKAAHSEAPVRVSGVVTALDPGRFFVQDETGAVTVARTASAPTLAVGDVCEVTGTLIPQTKALEMAARQVTKVGTAPLPAARAMKVTDAAAGRARGQRVKLSAVVHEVGAHGGEIILALQSDGLTFLASWRATERGGTASALPVELFDAQVEIEGVPVPQPGSRSVATDLQMLLQDSSHVQVRRAGNADVFTRPTKTLEEMRDLKLDNGERYRMKGKVTFWSDAGWFYFTDGTSSARGNNNTYLRNVIGWPYRTAPGYNPPLKPGDEIEIVGTRRNLGPTMPHLAHCEWRVIGSGDPPVYEPVSASEVDVRHDGEAVSIVCRLDEVQFVRDSQGFINHTLWATSSDRVIQVLVQKKQAQPVPIKPGEFFRAHGTVSFSQSNSNPRTAFRLNVNRIEDLAVLPPPPPWRNPAVLRGIVLASLLFLAAIIWIFTLRRQVKAQTAQLQHQLEHEKEISEMKSRFVFTVSHEFRNPLAVIMSCSDVLQRMRGQLPDDEHERQISGIQTNVRRMADMMEELLLLGRCESGRLQCQPESTDVNALCAQIVDQVRSATSDRCPIERAATEDITPRHLDPGLLQHILTNLLTNAVKYSPAGSAVELRVEPRDDALVFTVTDHGPGIPEGDQPHLFEPFHRGGNAGQTSGSGLGLAIVQRCVQAHGGTIQIESSADAGTRATVRLPTPPPDAPPGA